MRRRAAAACVSLALVGSPRRASACGAAYPGGPIMCTMDDAPGHAGARLPTLARVGVSWSYTTTTILFGNARRADLTRHTVFAGSDLPLGAGFGLRFGAGGVVAGELTPTRAPQRGTASFGPGAGAYLGIAKTIVDETTYFPSLQLGVTASGTRAATRGPAPGEAPSFTAFDARGSATLSKTFFHALVPYVAGRGFGGPVYYHYAGAKVTGTDLYKYQLALGCSVALRPLRLDAFFEGVPKGERGLSAGLGMTF